MTYKYGRYHEDGLGDYNYQFMQKEGDKVPADQLFANFNWNKEKNDHSVEMANGWNAVSMMFLQVWNCNKVVLTRQK